MKTHEIVAGLAGGVTLFLLGFVFYVLLFGDFFLSSAAKDPPIFPAIILGELVWGCLLAWLFSGLGVSSVAEGAKTGALIGVLASIAIGLILYGAYDLSTLTQRAADVVVVAIRYGAAGAVIGWLLGRGSPAASTSAA